MQYLEITLPCFKTDINGDGVVNKSDLNMIDKWWYTSCSESNAWCNNSDVDRSGFVDLGDLLAIGNCYEKPIVYSNSGGGSSGTFSSRTIAGENLNGQIPLGGQNNLQTSGNE